MPMQHHDLRSPCDLDSRKIKAVRSDALELIIHDIRQAIEQAIAEGVDLDHFEWRLRRKIKTKKGSSSARSTPRPGQAPSGLSTLSISPGATLPSGLRR